MLKRLFAFQPEHPARLLLMLAVVIYLLPAAWRLGGSDSMYHMEQMSLLPAQETWLRMERGEQDAWNSPTMRGIPRIRKPPLVTWVNLVAWSGLEMETAEPSDLTLRARWVAMLIGLIGVLSTAWIGSQLYTPLIGARAAVVLASVYTVLKQARMATFDTYLLGWVTLAIAASLAFSRTRLTRVHAAWFFLAFVASSFAFLSKGAVGLVYLIPPLLGVGILTPSNRVHPVRLGIPVLLGFAVFGAWLWDVLLNVPGAKDILAGETLQNRSDPQPVLYYVIVIGLVFPWTVLWIGLLTRIKKAPLRQLLPWIILLACLVILSIPDNRRQRYVIPLMPWFALGFSVIWARCMQEQKQGGLQIAAKVHVGLLSFLSVVLALAIPFQPQMVRLGWIKDLELPGAGFWAALVFALWTWTLCWIMGVSVRKYRMTFLIPLTALWLSGVYTFAMTFYVDSYHGRYPHLEETSRLRKAVGVQRTYLSAPQGAKWTPPDDRFLYHSLRFFKPADMNAVFPAGSLVLVPSEHAEAVPEGWSKVDTFQGRRSYTLFAIKPES